MDRGLRRCMAFCIVSPLAVASLSSARAAEEGIAAAPDASAGLGQVIGDGRPLLQLRPRYNWLDESDSPQRGEGGTFRATAGWVTAPWNGVRLTAEGIYTDHFGPGHFNDDFNDRESPYPLLPDPRYAGVNRLFADAELPGSTRARLGRQVMRLGNQRWVSDNDFRQIPQVFDGVSVENTALANLRLSAAYFGRVRTTSGMTNDLHLTLLEAAWNPAEGHAITGYGVFHDQAQNGAFTGFADNSYRVLGVRAEGPVARRGPVEVSYLAEYAWQRPYSGGDARIDADYWRLGAGVGTNAWTVRYDYEVKGSNGGAYGVQMPLTDFYQYNGWTLHFFNTPPQGLRDQWATARYAWRALTLYGEVHGFRSDFGGLDFGRELDLGATYEFLPQLVGRLQYARYDPGNADTMTTVRKTWLTITYTY